MECLAYTCLSSRIVLGLVFNGCSWGKLGGANTSALARTVVGATWWVKYICSCKTFFKVTWGTCRVGLPPLVFSSIPAGQWSALQQHWPMKSPRLGHAPWSSDRECPTKVSCTLAKLLTWVCYNFSRQSVQKKIPQIGNPETKISMVRSGGADMV